MYQGVFILKKLVLFLLILGIAFMVGCQNNSEVKVKISPEIEKYHPTMSSVPGFPLNAKVDMEYDSEGCRYHWKADSGSLLEWGVTDYKVRDKGMDAVTDNEKIYWNYISEQNEKASKVHIKLELLDKRGKVLGRAEINLSIDNKGYVTAFNN